MAWGVNDPSWMTWGTADGSDVEISLDPNHIPKQYGLAEHLMSSHYIKTTRQRITHHKSIGMSETIIDTVGLDIISATHTQTERPVDGNPVPVVASATPTVPAAIVQGKRWVKYLPPKIAGVDNRISFEIAGGAELARTLAASVLDSVHADFRKDKILGGETVGTNTFVPKAGSDVSIALGAGWTMLAPRNSTSPINPNGYTLEYQKFVVTATPDALTTHPLAAYVASGYYGSTVAGISTTVDVDNKTLVGAEATDCYLISVTDTLTAGANRPATTDITWTVMPVTNPPA